MKITTTRIVIALAAIVALQVIIGVSIYYSFSEWSERGQFGDMFGGVTALFTGLTLAGMIITLILQSQELKLQREELSETRQVMKLQQEEMAKSGNALNDQVTTMRLTARLNAINTLAAAYASRGAVNQGDTSRQALTKLDNLIPMLEQTVDLLSKAR